MKERNSQRGRKPNLTEKKLTIIRTTKRAKLVMGKDVIFLPKGQNVLIARTI